MKMDELSRIGMLSKDKTPVFDVATKSCAIFLDCKISLLSVIDKYNELQLVKSEHGLGMPWSITREAPLVHSFCKDVIYSSSNVVVPNIEEYEKYRNNPIIKDLSVNSYLGVPIHDANGNGIAALCVLDGRARNWKKTDIAIIEAISKGISVQISQMLEFEKISPEKVGANIASITMDEIFSKKDAMVDYRQYSDGNEELIWISSACEKIWGVRKEDFVKKYSNPFAMCAPESLPMLRAVLGHSIGLRAPWKHVWDIIDIHGNKKTLMGYGDPKISDDGAVTWKVAIKDISKIENLSN